MMRRGFDNRSSRGRLSAFARDDRAASAVEFALVAVPFIGILFATLNMGVAFIVKTNVNAAVQLAMRQIRTGEVQAANIQTAADFTSKYLCQGTNKVVGSFIDCSKMIVDVRTSANFVDSDLSPSFYKTAAANKFCLGAPRTITVVRVAYPMPYLLPVLSGSASNPSPNTSGLVNDIPGDSGWKLLIVAAAAFRTEPYPQSQYVKLATC